jgi:hypothetical protein
MPLNGTENVRRPIGTPAPVAGDARRRMGRGATTAAAFEAIGRRRAGA